MGRTWPNLDAERVTEPGYYWNEKLKKLARLQVGEKLPRHPGNWEFIAHEREGSSSEIVSKLFQRYPGMDVNEFTFTVRSPVGRRLPLGDRPLRGIRGAAVTAALFAIGISIGRFAERKLRPTPRGRFAKMFGRQQRRPPRRFGELWAAVPVQRKGRRLEAVPPRRAPLIAVLRRPQYEVPVAR